MWAEHTTMLITYDPLCASSQLGCRLQALRRSRLPAGSTLLHHAYTYTHADNALRAPGFNTGRAPHTGSCQVEGPTPTPARSGRGPTRPPPERAQRALSRRRAEGPQTQSSRAPATVPPDQSRGPRPTRVASTPGLLTRSPHVTEVVNDTTAARCNKRTPLTASKDRYMSGQRGPGLTAWISR
ncbi:hypothetical protein C2E23DRAFT_55325 [Lenzites betulinus]|nr:hypothetical protein C2E23DRAFT_55325 [Lenzites betulinus]